MGRESERGWLWLALALGASAGIAALAAVVFRPLVIQDDARQFVFWMAEWRDETLFRGDLVADYWRSVSPWLYVVIFRAADFVGIDPITTVRILPVILFPASAYFSFRFCRAISDEPRLACMATLFLLSWLIVEDGVVSSTPRAFAPLFLLVFLDGLARRSIVEITAGLFCLAGIYPHVALVAATVLCIIFIDFSGRPKLALTKANFVLLAAGAVAVIAGIAPFLFESSQFGPIVTPESAREFVTFGPDGRTSLFGRDGRIDFACGMRTIGIFDGCDGLSSPVFWLWTAGVSLAPALLFLRTLKTGGRSGSPIPLAVVLAAFAWFAIAIILAFRLHIPSRFVVRTVPMVSWLCLGLVIGTFFRHWPKPGTRGERFATFAGTGILLALFAGLALPRTLAHFRIWQHPALAEAVASYPPGTLFAGFVEDTDFIPLLAERRVLFSVELAVAYHLGYYRQIDARMRDMVEAELTPDPAVLAGKLEQNAVDIYLVNKNRLAEPSIDKKFAQQLGDFVPEQIARLGGAPTALSRLVPACSRGTFDGVEVLDAHCLIAAAR